MEFKFKFEILSWFSIETEIRILEDGVFEVHIACSAVSSFEEKVWNIKYLFTNKEDMTSIAIFDHSSHWHENGQIFCIFAIFVSGLTTLSRWSFIISCIFEWEECVELWIYIDIDMSSTSTIAAIGSAIRYSCFTSGRGTAISSFARFNSDSCMVEEFHDNLISVDLKDFSGL